jgi:O-acetyl-ADP-ribose deacetylase (regulator of RNase III)
LFIYMTGDILDSSADALVNTVNCEGFMGKGIAYQFKLRYPNNFKDYQRACKTGELRPGKLHCFSEEGKLIINFPTKDQWRKPSKIEYIESGLIELDRLIRDMSIRSIAIPPLGSGNGGLIWAEVRKLVEEKLSEDSKNVDIFIYEPSKAYATRPVQEPHLSTSALILMEMKLNLNKFSSLRLQKTAYFMNVFSHTQYFKFEKRHFGPYSHSIDIVCREIRAYQAFHQQPTDEAKTNLYRKLISQSVDGKLNKFHPYIKEACEFSNEFSRNHDLECLGTACYLIEIGEAITDQAIIDAFGNWSREKANRFTKDEILKALQILYDKGIIGQNMMGYYII